MRIFLFLALSFSAIAAVPLSKKVSTQIEFKDDLNFKNMIQAIDRHLVYFKKNAYMHKKFKLGTAQYTRADLQKTLIAFKVLVQKAIKCQETLELKVCQKNFSESVNQKFDIYRPSPKKSEMGYETKQSRFTAYYSPSLKGSKVKTDIYKYPMYKKPKNKTLRASTREEIEFKGKLAGKGLELFYVKDSLFDIWLLHVEGGGVIEEELANGKKKIHYISYNGTNGRSFSMLSRYMLKHGMITEDNRSVADQKKYLEENPSKEREVISSCQSYVYFKKTRSEPLGVRSIPLTMNRSLASDKKLFNEYGFISFINIDQKGVKEKEDSKDISIKRFFINQDTGGAIKGNARGDLYMGYGDDAKYYANNLHSLGEQYLLILKNKRNI